MTYNVDEGTDFIELRQAATPTQFLLAVGQTITQVRATQPPERMKAVARQIIAAAPTLVSLQEVDQWPTGPFNPVTGCGAVTTEFDMLQELLDALAAQGAHYEVAAKAQELAFPPIPGLILPSTYFCAQVSDSNVILARTDLDAGIFRWSNPMTGQFATSLIFPTPVGNVPISRSWISLDAETDGKPFRFIDTHLESLSAQVRALQGAELRAGPANTAMPVVIAMDSNAQAFPLPQDAAYLAFLNAGYEDAWADVFPLAPGLTCCQAQFVNNPVAQLYQRIDLVLKLGTARARAIALFGIDEASKTSGGLWPSDHAGVAAWISVGED